MTSSFLPFDPCAPAVPCQLPPVDVAIVGGGVVGLSLACALRQSALKVAVIEAVPTSGAIAKGQAYALHQVSRQFFREIGVWEALAPRIQPFEQVQLSDGTFSQTVRFDPQDLGTEVIGYVAEHAVLVDTLQATLKAASNVVVYCPWRVIETQGGGDRAQLTLVSADLAQPQVAHLSARLIVAADGGKSAVREQMGLKPWGWHYPQSCVVATLNVAHPQPVLAYERFWPTGPLGVLPLPGDRYRVVWTLPHEMAAAVLALEDAAFLAQLRPYLDPAMAEITGVSERFIFPTQLMQVTSYVGDRCVVIGDAAHRCHPVGGQGLNLGLRDVWALAAQLQAIAPQDIGSYPQLRQFQRQRFWQNSLTLAFTDLLNRLFSNDWLPLVLLRRGGLLALRSIPILRQAVLRFMAGLTFPVS
ncbi:FAD-dependent hydroxylase [Synechococcus sp. PCC 6716]|nr:FAD-dependent hydroxylase [Synechococcus sp. PCC 6716]